MLVAGVAGNNSIINNLFKHLTNALSKLHSARLSVPVLGDEPHQPIHFAFPSREFGKKNPTKRSFQARWFKQWK